MTAAELRALLESEFIHLGTEMLVDTEYWAYINDAYLMFARLTEGISDFTSHVTEVDVYPGEEVVELHPSILRVLKAYRNSDKTELKVINTAELGFEGVPFSSSAGEIECLLLGAGEHTARVSPVSKNAETVRLFVKRLPLNRIKNGDDKPSEIDEHHHIHLLNWVRHLIHKRPGTRFYDPNLASAYFSTFSDYCRYVRGEKSAAKHKPRSVRYGGI